MMPWEEFSWRSRSASESIENYLNTPLWVLHGEWDRTVGGGVDVSQSRSMADRFKTVDYDCRYSELPKRGHNAYDLDSDYFREVVLWLLGQKRIAKPAKVALVCHELRYNRNRFIAVEQLEAYGDPGKVTAEVLQRDRLKIETENVRALTLQPVGDRTKVSLEIDSTNMGKIELGRSGTMFVKTNSKWETNVGVVPVSEKRHGASGPFGDIFYQPTVMVCGTIGTDAENHINAVMARNAVRFYNQWNGGVHRGGIKGDNEVAIPVVKDSEVDEATRREFNLLCFGTTGTNSVLKSYAGQFPMQFKRNEIVLGGKSFQGEDLAAAATFPHPQNPERYLAVLGGVSFDAISWGSHLNLALLPDYLVFNRDQVIDWGFFDNHWRI
jgi:hypothetical protein